VYFGRIGSLQEKRNIILKFSRRQQDIEDWENHQQGKGYKNRSVICFTVAEHCGCILDDEL
jgi:hypothetical protein